MAKNYYIVGKVWPHPTLYVSPGIPTARPDSSVGFCLVYTNKKKAKAENPDSEIIPVDGVIMTAAHLDHIGEMGYDERKAYFLQLHKMARGRGCLYKFLPEREGGEEVEAANDTAD